jgi:hypothetical protein
MSLAEFLKAISGFLFPYRRHLEEECTLLRAQVAQQQRRLDVMQDYLMVISKPIPKTPAAPRPAVPARPRGWDSVRSSRPMFGIPPIDDKEKVHVQHPIQEPAAS